MKMALYSKLKYVIKEHKTSRSRRQAPTGFFLGLLLYPEDGGGMFLRNFGLFPNYMSI
jgi:hypothetical protein